MTGRIEFTDVFAELERGVHAALETYSNVHRGSGHNSMVSTHLYEQARDVVLEFLGLSKSAYLVIFCTPRGAAMLMTRLKPDSCQLVSSQDTGLPLGVCALAVRKRALPRGIPFQTGGGTARLVSRKWIIWAHGPDKFEAGTPAIVNIIAFAKALRMTRQYGKDIFREAASERGSATEILYHDDLLDFSGQELLGKLRQTLIGRGLSVPTASGTRPFINLDNGASTPTFGPVWESVCQTWREARPVQQEIIREVRNICSETLGAPLADYDVIFTSNTTEAINLAAESLGAESDADSETVVMNTLLEHTSNDLPWRLIPHSSLIRLPADKEGFVDLNELDALLDSYNSKGEHGKQRVKLVAVTGASNVLGVFNDLAEISRIVHRHGARLLVDAAQLAAHRKIDIAGCGIDYLALSAHKMYAPFGSGVLVVKKGLLKFSAAGMELIRSSGEENAVGIAALGKAFLLLQRIGFDRIREEEQALTARVLRGLTKIDGLSVYGIKDPDSPGFIHKGGVIVFGLPKLMSDKVAKELAVRGGIGVRCGCHCAHLLVKHLLNISPGLEQFQGLILTLFPGLNLPGLVRVSLGIGNTEEDVDTLISTMEEIARQSMDSTEVLRLMKDFTRDAAKRVYEPVYLTVTGSK